MDLIDKEETVVENLKKFFCVLIYYADLEAIDFVVMLKSFLETSKANKIFSDLLQLMEAFGKWKKKQNSNLKSAHKDKNQIDEDISKISFQGMCTYYTAELEELQDKTERMFQKHHILQQLHEIERCSEKEDNFMFHLQNLIKTFDSTSITEMEDESLVLSVYFRKEKKKLRAEDEQYILDVLCKQKKKENEVDNAKYIMRQMKETGNYKLITICKETCKRMGCLILEKRKGCEKYEIVLMCFDLQVHEAEDLTERAVAEYQRKYEMLEGNKVWTQSPNKRKRDIELRKKAKDSIERVLKRRNNTNYEMRCTSSEQCEITNNGDSIDKMLVDEACRFSSAFRFLRGENGQKAIQNLGRNLKDKYLEKLKNARQLEEEQRNLIVIEAIVHRTGLQYNKILQTVVEHATHILEIE